MTRVRLTTQDCEDWHAPGDVEPCWRCGGDGFVEYMDAPETWGEDSPAEVNHLVTCPECNGYGT